MICWWENPHMLTVHAQVAKASCLGDARSTKGEAKRRQGGIRAGVLVTYTIIATIYGESMG